MSEQAIRQRTSSLEKLRQGASKLFVEEGYHNTRPQDIAREAGVANGTFYLHFRDKKEAFLDPVLIAPKDEKAWQLYDRLGRFVEMAMDHPGGKLSSDYHPELISHALCGMLRHAMVYTSRKNIDREKMVDDLSLFVERGLGVGT